MAGPIGSSSSSYVIPAGLREDRAVIALIARDFDEVGDLADLLGEFGRVLPLHNAQELGHQDVDIALISLTGEPSDDELLVCGVVLAERGSPAYRMALGPANDSGLVMGAINVGRCECYLPHSVNPADLVAQLARGLIAARRRQAAAGHLPDWMHDPRLVQLLEQAMTGRSQHIDAVREHLRDAHHPIGSDQDEGDDGTWAGQRGDEHVPFNRPPPPTPTDLEHTLTTTREQLTAARQRLRISQDEILHLELQASISQLVRGLAHELNNPLSAILGHAQRLERGEPDAGKIRERAVSIQGEIERCIDLVERLRSLSIPAADRIETLAPAQLLPTVSERLALRGLAVPLFQIDDELPEVQGCARSLVRALELVAENAVEAGATRIDVRCAIAYDRAVIHLDNNGEPPTEESIQHAGRPFFTTRSHDGHHGLGLTVASTLIREMGGSITLDRREDEAGARCSISLPLLHPEGRTPSRAHPAIGDRTRVLVVDDEPMIAELLIDALRDSGLDAETCCTTTAAMDRFASGGISAVICDVHLPDGDGLELVREVVRTWPELHGRVALLTGDTGDPRVQQVAAELHCPVIGKPFKLDAIQAILGRLLETGRE